MPIKKLLKSIVFAIICAVFAYSGFRLAQQHLIEKRSNSHARQVIQQDEEIKFELSQVFLNMSNEQVSLASLQPNTEIYVINFWATWCRPCVTEMPLLNDAYNEYKEQNVLFVGLSTDAEKVKVDEFLTKIQIDYPILMANSALLNSLQNINPIGAIPFTLFLDNQGNIISSKLGVFDEKTLAKEINSLLE